MMREYTIKTELAVIGAGPAGLSAAISARRQGMKVTLLEKNGYLGGNATLGLPLLGFLDVNARRIVGGIADEYVNEKQRFGHWKDGGVSLHGDAARGFARLFLLLYDFTVGSVSDYESLLSKQNDTCRTRGGEGYLIPFGSGPAPAYSEPVGKNVLLSVIETANRYLYVTTPYLIIDYELTEALRGAAKRGVDVRVITPHIADKKLIKIMTKGAYPYLLRSGVRIFEYTPGFIHEKLVIADDTTAVSGTVNLDYRSLVHHFEDGVWMFMSPEIMKMRDSFLLTEDRSHEILEADARLGPFERLVKALVKIFAPLL